MQIAVLLDELLPVFEADLDVTRLDEQQGGADLDHGALGVEAGANPLFEIGLGGIEVDHGRQCPAGSDHES